MEKYKITFKKKAEDQLEEEEHLMGTSNSESFRHKSSQSIRSTLCSWRTAAEVVMLLLGAFLISILHISSHVENRIEYGPVIKQKVVTWGNQSQLGPDLVYADAEMFINETRMAEVLENWSQIFPKGKGFVKLKPEDHETITVMDEPVSTFASPDDETIINGHTLNVFHGIHCMILMATNLGPGSHKLSFEDRRHQAHCVDYVRQAILCKADTSLEGSLKDPSLHFGDGSLHMCTDYEALVRWASERAVYNWDGA